MARLIFSAKRSGEKKRRNRNAGLPGYVQGLDKQVNRYGREKATRKTTYQQISLIAKDLFFEIYVSIPK
ncbi:MAG: hypothetical protein H7Y01_14345 [Ferruginibacter sp.]|nr:hypothetical protein [Chitinophagaceae bacterium]